MSSYEEGGFSLVNLAELIFSLLDAEDARSVAEVGAFRGELTRKLLERRGQVTAIDPEPQAELLKLAEEHPELELVHETSHDALSHLPIPDAVILDGDHNYFTMDGELRVIAKRAESFPLVMFHDVGWPLARRDSYHAPERIPEERRQPMNPDVGLAPEPGFDDPRPFARTADHEGGPRNGILTAIEDFMAERDGLRFALVPLFFGFGVMWHEDAPWADDVAQTIEPWDRHPVLERVEAHRVRHLFARAAQARQQSWTSRGPAPRLRDRRVYRALTRLWQPTDKQAPPTRRRAKHRGG
jgi:SAM-dependent methyltransferase